MLILNGLPKILRFDRDPRFLSSWMMDGYPSPLVRFLLCLGVTPDPTPPRRPDLKPFVERTVRTVKYEALIPKHPENALQAEVLMDPYRYFFNHERPHQGSACNNQPPYVAFPQLPRLAQLPDEIDPDAWVPHYHRHIFKRRLNAQGSTTIDKQTYYVGIAHAGKLVRFHLDAYEQCFHVIHQGNVIKHMDIKGLYGQRLSFSDYLSQMLEEARSIERRLALA